MDSTEGASTSTWFKPHIEDKNRSAREKYSMRTRVIIFVVGSLLSWGVVLLPVVAFGHEYVLVGTEFDTEYLPRFQKWAGVLERHRAGPIATGRACADGVEGACAGPTWLAFLDQLETGALSEQLIQVNRYVNEIQYMQDVANWGESDHWAAPAEFFANGGDCEDYAIAKYFLLRELGVPPEQLKIVVLHDRRRRQTHAVLTVTRDHRTLVLDNLRDRIVPWRELDHYLPIYSLNERSAWLHARAESLLTQRPGG
jgi:predicted transglutaminase-like cysteine proteinase